MNKTINFRKVFTAILLAFVMAAAAGMSVGVKKVSALDRTRNVTVLSANYYDNALQVQYRILSHSTDETTYEYALRYSFDKADFESDTVSDRVAKIPLDATDTNEYGTVRAELQGAEEVGSVFYAVESKATASGGETTYTYTTVAEAKKTDLSDADQAYLVDCGSMNRYSFYDSSEAAFTKYQSSSWQEYGEDPLTGFCWGIETDYEFTQSAAVAASKRSLMGTSLNSAETSMKFRFEVEDDSTAYTVVMGFQDQNSSRINSAGDIYVNGAAERAGRYVGAYNGKIVSFSDVKAFGNSLEGYFIELEVRKSAESIDNPLCNFISIRKKEAENNLFLGAAYTQLNVKDGTAVSELPEQIEVYTTAGAESLAATYEGITDSRMALEGRTYYSASAEATVLYNEKTFTVPVDIDVWTKNDIYYFVDCAQTLPFSASIEKYEWLKENSQTLLNVDALDKVSNGSDDWGLFGIAPKEYWGNIDSYESFYEGNDYTVSYNFPGLPKGTYIYEVGITDPWGPRTTRILINGEQVDYFETKTSQKVQKTVTFTVKNDNDPVYITLRGTNSKALAGWMMISRVGDVEETDGGSLENTSKGCSGTAEITSSATASALVLVSLTVAAIVLSKKHKEI